MVNRLEPTTLRWIESSLAEQAVPGLDLPRIAAEVVPRDRPPRRPGRAEDGSGQALVKGEVLGLVVRIKTARGKSRAIEMNVGRRYGAGQECRTSAATSPT